VGTQFPHAAGVALALQMRGEARVAVAVGGDGATSKGDFYEALNIAGVWQLPAVFIINNNRWAISVPRKAQSAAETLAQKAIAAGVPGEQVDGNDVVAVYEATRNALQRARQNNGPTLIEAVTYRLSDHTTADDAARYRTSEEVSPQWKLEPLARLRAWLVALRAWDKAAEIELISECRNTVDRAVKDYLGIEPPVATDMFDHLYAQLPSALEDQRAELAARGDRAEADHG
jgi:pyruvate dehydrogenase E1 component alpha subunit